MGTDTAAIGAIDAEDVGAAGSATEITARLTAADDEKLRTEGSSVEMGESSGDTREHGESDLSGVVSKERGEAEEENSGVCDGLLSLGE